MKQIPPWSQVCGLGVTRNIESIKSLGLRKEITAEWELLWAERITAKGDRNIKKP